MNPEKQTAMVTGGASGIGLATVTRLARDGFHVLALDRHDAVLDESERLRREGFAVTGVIADVTDRASLVKALNDFPRIDVVVAAAGIAKVAPFESISDEDFHQVIKVNLYGVFLTMQEGLRRMVDGGRIVAVASRGVLGDANVAHYCASKAGVVGLVRALAFETRRRQIAVNAVAPGLTDTAMIRMLGPERLAAAAKAEPRGRPADPAEIAHAISFLVSPATSFITGQTLFVDGGKSLGGLAAAV